MTWLRGLEHADRDEVLALRPGAAERADELERALRQGALDTSLVELVRLRVGQILGVPGMALDTARTFDDREHAALAFAEQYVMDPAGITDDDARRLNELFTEPELTALTFCVAVCDAMGRVGLVLELDPANGHRP